jgi:hypothetical protein
MKKAIILEKIFILVLIGILILLLPNLILSGKSILESTNRYSYTKAICNEYKYCEDYIVKCEGQELKGLTPTGFSIQHNSNWVDKRIDKDEFCN